MILLRDFALFVLPGLVAAGGWLYALSLRQRVRPMLTPREKVERGSSPRSASGDVPLAQAAWRWLSPP